MTEHALDRRGRAAATGLRAAVGDHPVPLFDPDVVRVAVAPRRPDRRRPVLLAAAAALLVVAAVVAVVRLGGDGDDPPVDVVPGDVRRFVLPDGSGLRLGMLWDRAEPDPGPRPTLSVGPTTYYGTGPDAPALGVRAMVYADGVTAGPDPASMPNLDVGGREAWRGEGTGPGDDVSVVVGDALVAVDATGAEEEQILAAAGAVVVDGDGRATLPGASLPVGWEHLGTVRSDPGNPETGILVAEAAAPVSWAATYWGDEGREVAVTVAPGSSVRDRVPELVTDDVDEVDVRGHDALVARTDADVVEDVQTVSVTWEERPGEIVQVIGAAELGVETVVDLARDVVAIAPDATAGLRRQMFEDQISALGTDLVGRGTLSTGVEWALIESSDDDYLELVTKPPASRRWMVHGGPRVARTRPRRPARSTGTASHRPGRTAGWPSAGSTPRWPMSRSASTARTSGSA